MIANATLRHRFGIESSYTNAGPLNRQLKSVFGRVIRKVGLAAKNDVVDMVTFKIDPSAPDYVVNIEPYQRDF